MLTQEEQDKLARDEHLKSLIKRDYDKLKHDEGGVDGISDKPYVKPDTNYGRVAKVIAIISFIFGIVLAVMTVAEDTDSIIGAIAHLITVPFVCAAVGWFLGLVVIGPLLKIFIVCFCIAVVWFCLSVLYDIE